MLEMKEKSGSVVERRLSDSSTLQDNIENAPITDEEKARVKARQQEDQWTKKHPGDKIELTETEAYEALGFSFSTKKKWWILSVIFLIQVSMNLNASLYSNANARIAEQFGVSEQAARSGQAAFLIAYAFGCELWAAPSEEMGRWPILQLSLMLVNLWQIPVALAPNFATVVIGRLLGGLSSAGGGVTLAVVADLYEPAEQQMAVYFVVFSSVFGSVVGPLIGGPIEAYLDTQWCFWVQMIIGGFVQALHWTVPETRSSVLVTREAKRRRKAGQNVYSSEELKQHKITFKEILTIWTRPFKMFATEPIVLFLSLLSGFSDALIFTFLEGFTPVYKQWNFSTIQLGLAFIPLAVGYFIAYASFIPVIYHQTNIMKKNPNDLVPEARLWWLLFTAPLLPIGLIGFAWTSLGPPVHWIGSMIFASMIGIANYAIYGATIDYMIASYGAYSASATGGNGMARDFLAGIAAYYGTPLYSNLGTTYHLEWASTLLAGIGLLVVIPVYVFYFKGAWFRARSPFAQTLAADRDATHQGRKPTGEARHLEHAPDNAL